MKSISFYLLTLVFIGEPDDDNDNNEIIHFVSLQEDKDLAKEDLLFQVNEYFNENMYKAIRDLKELTEEKYEDTFRVQIERIQSKTCTHNNYINVDNTFFKS